MKIKGQSVFRSPDHPTTRPPDSERGFMLLALMLLVTLMLIGLALEAPSIAQQIKRDKEEELIHRGNEYKNAIKKYFRKFGQYPASLDQLVSTNNMRFLRRRYKDPFTGKDDWRILHPGEVQINAVNGGTAAPQQLGQPQPFGQAQPAGQSQPIGQSQQFGQPQQLGQPQPFGQTGGALGQPGAPATPSPNPSPGAQPGTDPNASGGTPGVAASSLTSGNPPVIGGGPMIGIASTSTLKSIKEINGKNHYNDWQFVYDPRLEVQSATPGAPGAVGANPIGGATPNQTQPPAQNPPGMTQPRLQN